MQSHEQVLVVEDEPLIRMLAVDMVEEVGLVVREASNAAEALEILRSDSMIGCVFTDVNMPGEMNGLQLADAIRHRWPHILVIVTTGDSRQISGELFNSNKFVPKPYSFKDLSEALAHCT